MDSNEFINCHSRSYKNEGKNFEYMRKTRNTTSVELRKNRRDELIQKRRNQVTLPNEHGSDNIPKSLAEIDKLVQECDSSNPDIYIPAILNLRVYLSLEKVSLMEELLSKNIVDILIRHLDEQSSLDVKYNITWGLTNIASGSSQQTAHLLKDNVIASLLKLLSETHVQLVEQTIWALSNIMGDGPSARSFVLERGIFGPLRNVLSNFYNTSSVMKQFSWTMINICRKKESEVSIDYLPQIIPLLNALLEIKDEPILSDTLWAITHLADSSNNHISAMISGGIVDKLFPYFSGTPKLILSSLRAIGNVAAGTNEHTQYLIDRNIYTFLQPLFSSVNSKIKKEVYWLLSNIAAGTRQQMLTLFNINIFGQVIKDLEHGEYQVQREACWVVTNVLHSCEIAEAQPFIDSRVLFFMNRFLKSSDTAMIIVVLEVILILLRLHTNGNKQDYICERIEESGTLDSIEELQCNSNANVKRISTHILEKYFSEDNVIYDETTLQDTTDTDIGNPFSPTGNFDF